MGVRIKPFDHAWIVLFPAGHEQALLGKLRLRVKNDDLAGRVTLFQQVRDHRYTLIRARRAAIRVRRRHHHESAALPHLQNLVTKKLYLCARSPGMRHAALHFRRVAGDAVILQRNARRQDKLVIGHLATMAEIDNLVGRIHGCRPLMDNIHTAIGG